MRLIQRMDKQMINTARFSKSSYLIFATSGLLGGLAEIAWMYMYNLNNNLTLTEIGREIGTTVHISFSNPYTGLLIHLSLSALIGVAYGKLIVEKFCKNNFRLIMLSSLFILASIWLCTFKLILPLINADMAAIVPQPISFISKMMFGVLMALSYCTINMRKKGKNYLI